MLERTESYTAEITAEITSGKDELLMDNAAIDVERQNLWAAMGKLEQMILINLVDLFRAEAEYLKYWVDKND